MQKNLNFYMIAKHFVTLYVLSFSLQPCMHSFCSGCYSDWMERSRECPSVSLISWKGQLLFAFVYNLFVPMKSIGLSHILVSDER